MSDLRERVPGHSLIDELLRQWDAGTIHLDAASNVVIDDEAAGWYQGVLGERRVAALLEQLGEGWTVLHSVPVGRGTSDIDHVAIGPPGVFTINTKYSPGRRVWVAGRGLLVEGVKTQYINNAIYEARRASTYLSKRSGMTVPVTGVIAFVDAGRFDFKAPAGGGDADPTIHVVRESDLYDLLFVRREFSDEQLVRIVSAAIQPGTWHQSPLPSSNASHISREFVALEEAVGPAFLSTLPSARSWSGVLRPVSRSRPAVSRARPVPSAPRPRTTAPRKRRPKRSRFERALSELAVPIVVLIGVWVWAASR